MSLIIIELENMEFHACHGCYPLEQVVGNRFLVDVKIEADLSKAAASDNVADTINYLNVFETVREQMDIPSHILEHVARRKVSVKVSKMAPPLGGKIEKVSVTLVE